MASISQMRFRLFVVGLLLVGLVGAIALTRRPEGQFQTGLSREKFWLCKLHAPPVHDLVLTGDSRTLCDLDPAAFEKQAPGQKVLNFGFNYVALTPEYLDAALSKLDPASKQRTILVGITPRSITPLNARVSGYVEEVNRPSDERFFNWHMNAIDQATRPMGLVGLVSLVRGGYKGYKDFFPNGYMAVSLRPPDPKADLKVYQRVFIDNQVSQRMIDALLAKVSEMSAKGVRVLGIRLPTSPEIWDCEERMSGFNEKDFVRRFEANGGRWLERPTGFYQICDGSHLDAASVELFSTHLAATISGSEMPGTRN